MQKMFGACLASMLLLSMLTYGQTATETPDYTRPATIGVQFFLNDYKTAKDIRATSISTVLDKKQFGKIKEMSPGLAIFYTKGINNHLDYAVTAAGSFVTYTLQNRPENTQASDKFLLEVDASVIGKMVPDKYWIIPTVNLGVGISKYGAYYGTFIPAGVGLQVNIFDEAFVMFNSQYRIPITETANYHFYHSIGIAGTLNKKGDNSTGKLKPRPEFPLVAR